MEDISGVIQNYLNMNGRGDEFEEFDILIKRFLGNEKDLLSVNNENHRRQLRVMLQHLKSTIKNLPIIDEMESATVEGCELILMSLFFAVILPLLVYFGCCKMVHYSQEELRQKNRHFKDHKSSTFNKPRRRYSRACMKWLNITVVAVYIVYTAFRLHMLREDILTGWVQQPKVPKSSLIRRSVDIQEYLEIFPSPEQIQELQMDKMSEIKKINSFYSKYKGEKNHETMLKLKAGEDVFECLTVIQDEVTYLKNLDDAIQLKRSVYLIVGIFLVLSVISLFIFCRRIESLQKKSLIESLFLSSELLNRDITKSKGQIGK